MTRTKTDTIIGIVGAVAIVFTLVGVFAYEYNSNPDDGGDTDEPVQQIPSQSHSGELARDTSFDANFTPSAGVTGISIRIEWTPAADSDTGALATYSFELKDPDGTTIDTGSRTTGTTLNVPTPVDGEYILTIAAEGLSLGGSYTITATYDY